jgi:NAD(P)-dependent dehydrogenase (short-subunit alcohol dehydrogenase family)
VARSFPPLTGDLSGRTCVVTGASGGIGKETARALVRMGARVVLACRSRERGEAARREIEADTGRAGASVMELDASRQASVRAFARELAQRHDRLHVLVNNASLWSSRRRETQEGVELTWATNVLGYFLLSELLLDLLRASAPSRVVNVASRLARGLDLSDVEFRRRRYDGVAAYAQSKQAERMLTWALARRVLGTGVTANAVHPGGVATGIFRKGGGFKGYLGSLYARLFGKSPREGADSVVWLAADPELEQATGTFWEERAERRCRYRDYAQEEALWQVCETMTARAQSGC